MSPRQNSQKASQVPRARTAMLWMLLPVTVEHCVGQAGAVVVAVAVAVDAVAVPEPALQGLTKPALDAAAGVGVGADVVVGVGVVAAAGAGEDVAKERFTTWMMTRRRMRMKRRRRAAAAMKVMIHSLQKLTMKCSTQNKSDWTHITGDEVQ